ncbi:MULTISPECIES: hypothetical protein [unclassified Vibrio]|uniref:hypothetical protein n=1 Tax=unclassified Vibrio TaxID=2614977 RepID=UPI00159E3AFE|nr:MULTISPECIES: hypothetical protein [unclassified Vibrio]NVN80205.1 hypothetical protein [Vibrio sp. Scap16]QLE95975.1 hypothetical protein FLM53_23705 [Vibrio sp. Scap24]
MKKVAIAIAVMAALGSTVASADNNLAASTTLTKNVPQECNIGLWATGSDGSVGGSLTSILGTGYGDFVSSELNDLKTTGQSMTGAVKCNANGGYTVTVVPTYGVLRAQDNNGPIDVNYTLEFGTPTNFKHAGAVAASLGSLSAGGILPVGTGSNGQVGEFKVIMKAPGSFDYAGQYTETLTFDLTPL